jgi:hypothetical protein
VREGGTTRVTEVERENKGERIGAQRNQFKDFLLLIPSLTLLPAELAKNPASLSGFWTM